MTLTEITKRASIRCSTEQERSRIIALVTLAGTNSDPENIGTFKQWPHIFFQPIARKWMTQRDSITVNHIQSQLITCI